MLASLPLVLPVRNGTQNGGVVYTALSTFLQFHKDLVLERVGDERAMLKVEIRTETAWGLFDVCFPINSVQILQYVQV